MVRSILWGSILIPVAFSFAFGVSYGHPQITEEIINFYNYFAERKITPEQKALIIQGSKEEDNAPRWINHFYDPIHNIAWVKDTWRGSNELTISGILRKVFDSALISEPIISFIWAGDELMQIKYGLNRTWQKGIRSYFDNQAEPFLVLGHILHLLEDLGIPEHTRGDAHPGTPPDPGSYYEEYAKKIFAQYQTNFAQELIDVGEKPYLIQDYKTAFKNLANFTAYRWFSEDTIKGWNVPKFSKSKPLSKNNELLYNDRIPVLLVIKKSKDEIEYTTNHPQILESWFKTIMPEIIKYGAGIIDLYFREIKEREKELALRTYDLYQQRVVELSKIGALLYKLNPFYYLKKNSWKIVDFAAKVRDDIRVFSSVKNQKSELPQVFSLNQNQFSNNQWEQKETEKEESIEKDNPEENLSLQSESQTALQSNYQEKSLDINQEVVMEIISLLENLNQQENSTETQESSTTTEVTQSAATTTTNDFAIASSENNTSTNKTGTLFESEDEQKSKIQDSQMQNINPQQIQSKPPLFFAGGPPIPPPKPKDKCEELSNKDYPNLIISEIQYESKNNKDDEFIEIYNPNNEPIDLTCWTLEKIASKKSATETPSTTILWPKTKSTGTIKPFGFYLLTSQSYTGSTTSDYQYANSYSITKNNTLILKKPNGQISDLVGAGKEKEKIYQFEAEPFIGNQFSEFTLQRKNLIDTDNNHSDFWFHPANPENSQANPRTPNPDFFDLTLTDFSLETSFDATNSLVAINFDLNPKPTTSINFDYEILLDASQTIFAFSSSSKPALDFSITTLTFNLNSCPTTKATYEISFKIFDLNDDLNFVLATDTLSLPEEFCNPPPTNPPKPKDGAQKGKVLISEVLIDGGDTKEEFIELYNPNPHPVDLTGYSLVRYYTKRDHSLGEQTILPKSKFTGVIPAYAYFLIVNQSASTTFGLPDLYYAKSYNLAKDNAIALLDPENNIVDLVGWGDAPKFETNPYPDNPAENQSLHRKATNQGDLDKDYGNAYDTDNNQNDFLIATPEPKNSDHSEPPPLTITDFNLTIDTNTFQFSWLSPYATETDLIFVLTNSINTSTVTTTLQTLTYQTISFNACSFFGETEVPTGTQFILQLLNTDIKDQKTITLSENFANCISRSLSTINDYIYSFYPFGHGSEPEEKLVFMEILMLVFRLFIHSKQLAILKFLP